MAQKSHVHCTVDNCKWWSEPNLCTAEKVLVVSNEFANDLSSSTDVQQTNQIVNQKGLSPIDECTDCCCKTFVDRDEYDDGLGG